MPLLDLDVSAHVLVRRSHEASRPRSTLEEVDYAADCPDDQDDAQEWPEIDVQEVRERHFREPVSETEQEKHQDGRTFGPRGIGIFHVIDVHFSPLQDV